MRVKIQTRPIGYINIPFLPFGSLLYGNIWRRKVFSLGKNATGWESRQSVNHLFASMERVLTSCRSGASKVFIGNCSFHFNLN